MSGTLPRSHPPTRQSAFEILRVPRGSLLGEAGRPTAAPPSAPHLSPPARARGCRRRSPSAPPPCSSPHRRPRGASAPGAAESAARSRPAVPPAARPRALLAEHPLGSLSVAATGQARPRAYGAAPPRGSLSLSLGARFFSPRAAAKGSLAAPGLRASAVASHRAGLANIEGSAPPHILRRRPLQPPPPRRYGLRSSSSVDAGAAHDSCEARARRWRSPVLSAEQHGSSAGARESFSFRARILSMSSELMLVFLRNRA
ncbi:hypothetical protein BDA96_10G092100 [Sorghum bicolor]|uniref:Uncharacterized protein n=1 Tax=Sorghum bicolor TaxID=4558 RepID=A0A921U0E0_SORBI|nr:hypothetical protein BDA96_10G092100 [Sorghum bicolor]